MSGLKSNGSVPSLPPPQPKSPPQNPDLYGKRRELAKVQMLEREIGFLQEELKSVDRIPPASTSCKEVADFVTGNVDPLIPTIKKNARGSCRFWKWLCGVCCFDVSWICCCSCSWNLRPPQCFDCGSCCNLWRNCQIPKCQCFSCPCWNSQCFKKWKCSLKWWWWCCCCCKAPSCPTCSCTRCTCYPKCPNLNICSCCHKCCCFPCYYCM